MNFLRGVNKIMDVLGFYGLVMRSSARDSAKSLEGRSWGSAAAGFSLSIAVRPEQVPRGAPVRVAVALRNETGADIRRSIPDWPAFVKTTITGDGGVAVEPTLYGQHLIAGRQGTSLNALFPAEEPVQIELPVSEMYDLSASGHYTVSASCDAPAGNGSVRVTSNVASLIVLP